MGSDLQIPTGTSTSELVDRRSRFIGKAQPLASPAQVREMVHAEREAHKGCTHVVHAFIAGDSKSQVQGSSDDGEPKGTAGRPVLEVLKGSGFTNVLLTVVRYYGGTNLGTGGLVRAYSDCAKEALRSLPGKPLRREVPFRVEIPYQLYERLKSWIALHDGEIRSESFGTAVTVEGVVPEEDREALATHLANLSGGTVRLG
jgi:uncharacterized YigZ family protein